MEASGRGQVNETLARASSLAGQRSPWHSPVPYLFGGLAAMLGLIAFALLILACSYWKLSGYLEEGNTENADGQHRDDLEAGNNDEGPRNPHVFEEKVLVIMAGQVKPTFLATPASSRSSSFGNNSNCGSCECDQKNENIEMEKKEGSGEPLPGSDTQGAILPEGY